MEGLRGEESSSPSAAGKASALIFTITGAKVPEMGKKHLGVDTRQETAMDEDLEPNIIKQKKSI